MTSQPPTVQPMPSQPIPSSMASQCAGARGTSLSSPSQHNASPISMPSCRNQNVPKVVQQMSTEASEASTYVDDDPPIGAVLEIIEPCNDGFYPSRVASKAITKTIKQQYVQPWLTWGAMSDEEKNVFFQRFKRKVTWRPEHDEKIRRIFNTKASHRLSEMFLEARKTGKKPTWMFDRVWHELLAKWNQPEFRSKSARNQKNRASEKGGSLHTGGSITIHEHALRMAQELGRSVHVDEVFHQTHVRKITSDFVDRRSKKTYVRGFSDHIFSSKIGGKTNIYGVSDLLFG
ncbi:uncharacterized protein LOC109791032 [Cajanus cajan]|uniref:uncharacterized protein LOC109791032 n=1 Tax=Cajanus cajan TaxID=3821 RepID=UPI00098DC0C9|nr:uncharacterized protein LOC109791032 [Cajanus cajan]